MLLDKEACREFKKETYIEQFFYHILYTQASVYSGGEPEELDANRMKEERNLVRDILMGWLRIDYFTERQMTTYYISRTFFQALKKTFNKITPLMDEEGLLESLHEDCCLIWNDTTYFLWRDPHDDQNYYILSVVNGSVAFFSSYSFGTNQVKRSHTMSFMHLDDFGDDDCLFIESIYTFLLFKKYGNVDIEVIAKKKALKKSQVLGEKVNNFMGIDVQVLDSRWFTTICRDEGFLVSGHFRLQPCKDENGEWTRKLIYINPYAKHGYHRLAPIVNINNE
jgi:hypothetical protein